MQVRPEWEIWGSMAMESTTDGGTEPGQNSQTNVRNQVLAVKNPKPELTLTNSRLVILDIGDEGESEKEGGNG